MPVGLWYGPPSDRAERMEAQAGSPRLEIVLLHELSSGTFARLYLAEARAPGGIERIVAVKILREQWNESAEVINRTRDEARLLARLRHKNILRVEDLSEIDGQLAIIMEFVDGLDLKQLVEALAKKGRKIPPRAALQIVADTAAALEAAYFKVPYGLEAPLRVVHRDIKPSNVMVSVEGELKVLDFGTARSDQAFRSVQTGALRFGSLKYMSPERREGDRGEHPADVYALGLMLVEILKGEMLPLLPLDPTEHDEQVAKVVNGLGALGMPNREWDVALRQILLQTLASDPALRPNAEQVAKLLRAFAEQAQGQALDSFASDEVAPLTRQIRGNLSGGALAGTRFLVNFFDPTGAQRGQRAPSDSQPPTPVPPPKAAPVQQEDFDPPTTMDLTRKSTPAVPSPAQVRDPSPRSPPSPRATAPRPTPAREARSGGGGGVAMAAGGVVLVGALACGGVSLAGGAWYYFSASSSPTPVVVTPPPTLPPTPAGDAAVSIKTEGGTVQWVRLQDEAGARVAAGQESLDAKVEAGTYRLSMKLVGRPALNGPISVPAGGVWLTCAQLKDNVRCTGVEPPVLLKP